MITEYAEKYRESLEALLKDIHAESAFSGLSLDSAKLIATLTHPSVFFRLYVNSDKVQGMIAGYVNAPYFSNDLAAYDLGWYVSKGARGGTAAIRLLREFESWAASKGAAMIVLSQTTGIDSEKVERIYNGCGYKTVGVCAMKEC